MLKFQVFTFDQTIRKLSGKGTFMKKNKINSRRVLALAGVIVLVLLYVITLIAAITDSSASGRLFALSLFASFAFPILIWIYTWLFQKYKERHDEES